jgi:hypothetical protein
MPSKQADLKALKRLIKELERVLGIGPIPPGIQARSAELFQSIYALTDDLIERTPAKQLGALGGAKTAERGPEYFKQIAAMRKTNAGGRPKKDRTVLTENVSPHSVRSRASFMIADRAQELGLDLAGVARAIGISEQYARDLLQGKKIPSEQTLTQAISGLSLPDLDALRIRQLALEDRSKS